MTEREPKVLHRLWRQACAPYGEVCAVKEFVSVGVAGRAGTFSPEPRCARRATRQLERRAKFSANLDWHTGAITQNHRNLCDAPEINLDGAWMRCCAAVQRRFRRPGVVRFQYTCSRHQQWFIDVVKRAGCSDPAKMEDVRRQLRGWFSRHYPRLMLDHFRLGSCLGCDTETLFGNLNEIDQAIRELVNVRAVEQRHGQGERARAAGHPRAAIGTGP